MQRLQCKFADNVFAPANAWGDGVRGEYETIDGVRCHADPQTAWNNEDGSYDDEFDDLCIRLFGCPFSTIRSIWIARLGHIDSFWHLVRLVRNG